MEVYVLINDQPQGPYTPDSIRQHLESGALQSSMFAAYAGSSDWQPLSDMVRSWDSPKGTRFTPRSTPLRKKTKATPWVAFGSVAVVLILSAAVFVWWKKTHASKTTVSTAALPDLGYPNTLAEWNVAYAEPPAGQNAATYYLKAFDAMQVTNVAYESKELPIIGLGDLPALGTPLPPRTKAAIGAFTKRNKAAWELIQQATKFEQSRFPMDLRDGLDARLTHLAKFRLATQVGELMALDHLENKQILLSAEVVHTSMTMAQSLRSEPTVIAQLVRSACITLNKKSLERIVNSVVFASPELERMSSALAKAEIEEAEGLPYTRAFALERSMLLAALDEPPAKLEGYYKMITQGPVIPEFQSATNQPVALAKVSQNLKAQKAFGEETYRRAIAMRSTPLPERLKVGDYFITRANEARTNELYFTSVMLSGLSKVALREAQGLRTCA